MKPLRPFRRRHVFIIQTVLLASLTLILTSAGEPPSIGGKNELKISMPNVTTSGEDGYVCTAFDITTVSNVPIYATGFHPETSADRAHHMLLFTCNTPVQSQVGTSWSCLTAPTCRDQANIIYGWAKNADNLKLPDGVSFPLDPEKSRFLVLQVHYANQMVQPDSSGLTLEISQVP